MKRLLAVTALLALSTAQAAELKFGDLNYFFKQNEANVGVDVAHSTYQFRSGGTKAETEGFRSKMHLNAGFTDDLYVSLDVDYFHNMKTSGLGKSYNEDGFSSPRLGVNYRLLKQQNTGFNLDFGGFYRLASLKEATRGSNGLDGNASNARDAAEVNVRLGNKWNEANEFYFLGGVVRNLEGEYKQKGSSKVDQDSSTDYYVAAFYQYRPINEFMFRIGGTATKFADITNKSAGSKWKTNDHLDLKFNFTAQYLITESFIAKFNYAQTNLSDYKEGTTKIDRRHGHSIGFGADFLF